MSVAPLSVLLPLVLMGLAPSPGARAAGVSPAPTATGSGTHPGADALSGVGEDALTEVIFDEVTVTLDPRGGGFSGEGRIVFRHTPTDGRCPGGSFDTPVELRYHGAYLPAPDGLILGTVALDVGPTSRSPACPDDPFRYVGPGTEVRALLARVDLPSGRITEEMGVFGFAVDIPPDQLRPSPTPLQRFLSTGDFDTLGRRPSPDDDVALARWLTLAGGADGTLAGRGQIVELTEIGDCKGFIVSDIVAALRVDDASHRVAGELRIDETIRPFTCDDLDALAEELAQARTGTIVGVRDPATGRLTLDPLDGFFDLRAFNPLTPGDPPGPAVNAGSIAGTPVQFTFELSEVIDAFGDIGLVPEVVTNGGELTFGPDGTVIGGSGAATVEGTTDDGALSVRSASTYRFLPSGGAADGTAQRGEVLHGTIVELRENGELVGVDIVDHPPNRYEVDPAAGIGSVVADAEGTVFGLTFPPFVPGDVSTGPGTSGDADGNPLWPWGGLLLGGLLGGGTFLGALHRRRASRASETTTGETTATGTTTPEQPGHDPDEGPGDEERSAWIESELDGIAQKAWVINDLTPEAREELIDRAAKVRAALRPGEWTTPTEEAETADLVDLLIRYVSGGSPRAAAVAEELPAAWRERHSESRTRVARELMHPAERLGTRSADWQVELHRKEGMDAAMERFLSGSGDRKTPPDDQTSESRAGDAPLQEVDPPGDIGEVLLGPRRRRRQLSADDPGDDPADDGRPPDGPEDRADGDDGDHPQG